MKARVTTGEKRRIECRDLPIPEVEPGWLLLKTKYACICGSDLEYLDGSFRLIAQAVSRTGAIKGHEKTVDTGIRPGSIPGYETYRCMIDNLILNSITGAVNSRL